MAHNNQGQIFIDNNTTPPIGISTADVAYVLGVDTNDVGSLCAHESVNMWSKRKPVRRTGLDNNFHPVMSDNDFKIVNYGFDLAEIQTGQHAGATTDDINLLFSEACYHQGAWAYLKPRGIWPTEPYSLSDFNNYHHNAVAPYFSGAPTNPWQTGNKVVDVHEEPDAEIKMSEFSTVLWGDSVASLDDVYIYMMYQKVQPVAGSVTVVTPMRGLTPITYMAGAQGHSVNFEIPFVTDGVYRLVAVATPWEAGSGDPTDGYIWTWLPGSYREVIIDTSDHILDMTYSEEDIEIDFAATLNTQNSTMAFRANIRTWNKNLDGVAENIMLHLDFMYNGEIFAQYTRSVYEDDDASLQYTLNVDEATAQHGSSALSYIYVRLWYSYDDDTAPSVTYYRYFDFVSSTGESKAFAYDALSSDPAHRVPFTTIQSIKNIQQ